MLITLSMSKPIKSKGQERGVEKLGEKVKKNMTGPRKSI